MTISLPLKKRHQCGLLAVCYLGLSVLAHAVAPDAVNDNLTASPVNQNQNKVILEATLIGNDAGDGKNIKSVTSPSSSGAIVTWSNGAGTVTYNPTAVAAFIALDSGASVDDTFIYTLQGTDGVDDTATVTVRVNGVNDPPSITGISGSTLNTNDEDTTNAAFTGAVISDPDTGETVTVTVTINASNEGTLTNLNGFTDNGGGSYSFTGTTADATTKLVGLNFVPTRNRIAPGTSDNTLLTVSVDDGTATPVSATRTVSVTSVNDVPVVTAGANRSMNDNVSLTIFSGVSFTDPDFQENISVTVTYDEAKGSFPASGFSVSGSGANKVLTIPSRSVANAQTAIRALVFQPEPDQVAVDLTEDLSFSIQANDGDDTGSGSLTVTVLSINDAPELLPSAVRLFTKASGETMTPFSNITVTDADVETLPPPTDIGDPPGDEFTATITLSSSPYGSIISSFFTGSGDTYTYAGGRSEVEGAIQGLQYLVPNNPSGVDITLEVADSSGKGNDTSNQVVAEVTITAPPAPGMSGLIAGQEVTDNAVIYPFASAAFNNFGGDRQVEITLDVDAKGSFDILGPFTKSGGVYRMTGNSVSATDAIQNLRFNPAPNRITGSSEVVTFTIQVTGTPSSSDTLALTVFPHNDAPVIASSGLEIRIDDDEVATPFATTSVTDVDAGGAQTLTVTVSLIGQDPDTNIPLSGGGVLAPADGAPAVPGVTFTPVGDYPDTTYTIVGVPAAVTTFLQALVFTPEANRNAIGERETVTFTVFVDDLKGGTAQNQNTTVIVTSVNGAPQINNVPLLSQQPFPTPASGNAMTMPFEALTVVDEENLTFTITLDDAAKGTLNEDDFTSTAAGVYEMTGTPAEITTALQALTYTLDPGYAFPPDQPGLTTFTLAASDSTNTTTKYFTVFIRNRNVAHIVTSANDSGPGSLREAISLAGNDDMIVFDFPVDEFPVTLALESTLEINKNLAITGSGVDQLTISGQGSVSLFYVTNGARLTLAQLSLKDGFAASYGGAVEVDTGCGLVARFCSFEGNHAGQYGGAIDVYQGDLTVEHCLFYQNGVLGSTAKGGGAISVYTFLPSSITNSTFVENGQENAGGLGGGAVYAENADLALFFDLQVEHCTFRNNTDAATSGSAVLAASAGLRVHLRNNILADAEGTSGLVLDVLGGGRFDSMGGNIATDPTLTTYTQGGARNVTLLDHATDKRSTPPLLADLANNGGATRTCSLLAGSPALDAAVAVVPASLALGTDQRGYWRGGNTPDIGAFESGAFKRVNINEIMVAGTAGTDFIEFYNPRDSETLDMDGLQLWIDGTLAHTFTTRSLTPGAGFDRPSTVDLNDEKGSIELRNAGGQHILLVDYVATFAEEGVELVTTGQSINRYPRYEGGFLPHQRVVENVTGVAGGDLTSPGDDVDGSPLSGGNAPPIAVVDVAEDLSPVYSILANESFSPALLLNDIEFDRTDTIKITEVMALTAGDVTNAELFAIDGAGVISLTNLPPALDTTVAPDGASVTIAPDQLSLTYDPIGSDAMIALHEGETVTDIWAYTIRDYDDTDTAQSRGADAAKQAQNIEKATSWFTVTVTGVNEAPEPVEDSFATTENQAVRLLADPTLLAPAVFDFGDLAADYQDFDATGAAVTLKPAAPTKSLLANDDDVDNDDTNASLLLVAVHTTEVPANLLETTSELDATVTLDIRAEREETSIIYDPRSSSILNALSAGETATDSFYYSVFDKWGARGVAKVTITVTGVNDVPKATDDGGFVANEDATLSIAGSDLLANDTDPDQDANGPDDAPVIVQPFDANSALGATLVFDGTTITYDPRTIEAYESLARNETITDTLSYSITDSNGGTSQATVTVVVEGRNDAPVAANDLLEILENATTEIFAANGLLSNDVDVDINGTPPDDDPWVLPQRNVTTPMGARLDIHPDGSYRYDANSAAIDSLKEGELAVETFPYTVIDNFRSTASDDIFKVLANRANVVLPVLLNDAVVGSPTTAVAAYSADITDATRLVIGSPNHALRDGLLIRIEGYEGAGAYNGVYAVTSIDRDHFSVAVPFEDDPAGARGAWRPWFAITAVATADQGGALSIAGGQNLLYTPTSGFHGLESFTYTIEDGVGGQDVGTVAIEVIQPSLNGFLSASPDRFHLGMGEAGVVFDVLANDNILPASGADLTITDIQPMAGATGMLEIINDGKNLRYTPADLGATGIETFTYSVSAGGSVSAETTVTFEVLDRTDLLSGSDDAFFVVIGSSGNLLDVLANDPSLPTFPVTSTLVKVNGSAAGGVTGSLGSVSISDNKVSYTPPASISTDTFTYTARDASGATTTQTVKVRVVPAAVDFYASGDHYTVVAGSGPVQLPVLVNDGAVQNDSAALQVVNLGLDTDSPPDVERVAISGGNIVQYTPPANAGTEDFNYEISIGTIERREAKITITVVDSFESAPDPEDDFFHVAKNSGPHPLDVLKNDIPYPAAGWTWIISAKTNPDQGGTLAIQGGGASLSYTPAPGFFGTETFTYTIVDAFGATAAATVSVHVGDLITAPDVFAVLEDSVDNPLTVLANDDLLDAYGPDYSISAVGTPDLGGAVVIDGSGPDNRLLYTPLAGVTGEETFTYTVVDQTGATHDETVAVTILAKDSDRDEAEFRVEITGINDVPMLTGTADGGITDKESTNPFGSVSITDLDEGGKQLQTIVVSFDSSFGTVVAPGMTRTSAGVYRIVGTPAAVTNALRGFVFTPYENFIDYINPGQADVVFTLSIDDGYIPTPILDPTTITVTPVDDAPTIISAIPDQVFQVNEFPRGFYLPLHFADVDDDVRGGELTWTVTGNTNPGLFDSVSVDPATLLLVLDFATDQAGFSEITVRGTDRGLLFVDTTFRVTVEGPPVILLAAGQTNPPAATFVSGSQSGFSRDYKQSFRVTNQGSLPVDAFIVHVSDLDQPVLGITIAAARYSTDENGSTTNFQDDVTSADGVTILRPSTYVYALKYDVPIPPGESVVVHLTYRVSSIEIQSIRPTIRISLSTSDPTGAVGIAGIEMGADKNVRLRFNVEAGRGYRLEYSPDLANWSPWLTPVPVSEFAREIQVVDDGYNTGSHPSESARRFYRLVEPSTP